MVLVVFSEMSWLEQLTKQLVELAYTEDSFVVSFRYADNHVLESQCNNRVFSELPVADLYETVVNQAQSHGHVVEMFSTPTPPPRLPNLRGLSPGALWAESAAVLEV
jgi:hypothetical protein